MLWRIRMTQIWPLFKDDFKTTSELNHSEFNISTSLEFVAFESLSGTCLAFEFLVSIIAIMLCLIQCVYCCNNARLGILGVYNLQTSFSVWRDR